MLYELFIVTSLMSDGQGTFAEAMRHNKEDVTRVVVFDVGGVINITSESCGLDHSPRNIIVKGETAPGAGVSLRSHPYYLRNAKNVTLQGLHFHLTTDPDRKGTAWSPLRIITDEDEQSSKVKIVGCTFTGGEDEQISCTPVNQATWQQNTPEVPHIVDLKIEGCRFNPAYTISRGNHNFACLVSLGDKVTFHRNFVQHANRRCPQIQGTNVLIEDNVIYNYGSMAVGCMAPGDYVVRRNVFVMGYNSKTSIPVAPISIQATGTTGPVLITHGGNSRLRYGSIPYAVDLEVDNQTANEFLNDPVEYGVLDPDTGWFIVNFAGAKVNALDSHFISQYNQGLGGWCRTEWAHGGFPEFPEVRDSYLVRKGIVDEAD